MLDELVTTKDRLAWWIKACRKAKIFGFDTETTGLKVIEGKDELVGICLSLSKDRGCYIPVAHTTGEPQLDFDYVVDAIAPILEDESLVKVAHNAAFDINVMAMLGVCVVNCEDTQLMSYALDGQRYLSRGHSFDALTKFHFDHDSIRFEDVVNGELGIKNFAGVQLSHACAYASEDARWTLELWHHLNKALETETSAGDEKVAKLVEHSADHERVAYSEAVLVTIPSPGCALPSLHDVYTHIDRPLAPVVADMKRRGVLVDVDRLHELDAEFSARVDDAQQAINEMVGREVNVGSGKQLAELLFDDLDLPILAETKKGAPKTDKDTLELLESEHAVIPLILRHSKFATLRQFTQSWFDLINPRTGRLHPGFNLTSTNTRRLSGSEPNLQNVPTRSEEGASIRKAFVAPEGRYLVVQDMSQIEYRILAHVCGSEKMRGMFRRGEDFHAAMAASVLGGKWRAYADKKHADKYAARSRFKNVNFAKIYGAGPKKIAAMCKIKEKDAYKLLADYADEFPEVDLWKSDVIQFAHEHGYAETLFGGRIHVPTIKWSDKGMVKMAERQAVNGVVQGTAADMMRLAMARVAAWLAENFPTAWLLLSVHDELVVECDEDDAGDIRAGVKEIVETCADHLITWTIPIVSEGGVAQSWGEAK